MAKKLDENNIMTPLSSEELVTLFKGLVRMVKRNRDSQIERNKVFDLFREILDEEDPLLIKIPMK